jgi:hypothetical protein
MLNIVSAKEIREMIHISTLFFFFFGTYGGTLCPNWNSLVRTSYLSRWTLNNAWKHFLFIYFDFIKGQKLDINRSNKVTYILKAYEKNMLSYQYY